MQKPHKQTVNSTLMAGKRGCIPKGQPTLKSLLLGLPKSLFALPWCRDIWVLCCLESFHGGGSLAFALEKRSGGICLLGFLASMEHCTNFLRNRVLWLHSLYSAAESLRLTCHTPSWPYRGLQFISAWGPTMTILLSSWRMSPGVYTDLQKSSHPTHLLSSGGDFLDYHAFLMTVWPCACTACHPAWAS